MIIKSFVVWKNRLQFYNNYLTKLTLIKANQNSSTFYCPLKQEVLWPFPMITSKIVLNVVHFQHFIVKSKTHVNQIIQDLMNKCNYITLHAVNVTFINHYKVSMKFSFFLIKQLTSSNRAYKAGHKKTNGFLRNVPRLRYGNVSVLRFF